MPSRPGCCELGHGNSSGLGFMIGGIAFRGRAVGIAEVHDHGRNDQPVGNFQLTDTNG